MPLHAICLIGLLRSESSDSRPSTGNICPVWSFLVRFALCRVRPKCTRLIFSTPMPGDLGPFDLIFSTWVFYRLDTRGKAEAEHKLFSGKKECLTYGLAGLLASRRRSCGSTAHLSPHGPRDALLVLHRRAKRMASEPEQAMLAVRQPGVAMLRLGVLDGQQLVPAKLLLGWLWISRRPMLRTKPASGTTVSLGAACAMPALSAVCAMPTPSAAVLTCCAAVAPDPTNAGCACL